MKIFIYVSKMMLFMSIFASLATGCATPKPTPERISTQTTVSQAPSATAGPAFTPSSVPSATPEPVLTPSSPATVESVTEVGTGLAPSTGQQPFWSDKAQRNYLLYLPPEYGRDPQKKWPLILFLHGFGTRSKNVETLLYEALPQMLQIGNELPFIVVSPQLTDDSEQDYWTREKVVDSLFTLLDEIQANYAVDPKKIYLTGVSLGGNGVWAIGLMYPKRFAALVPVMGFFGNTASVWVPDNICDLKDVPVWAFHGAQDHIVPLFAEQELVDALKACGGNVQFTVYPDGDHNISGQVYTDPDLYTWLETQSLK
jgi:predicted peptidase